MNSKRTPHLRLAAVFSFFSLLLAACQSEQAPAPQPASAPAVDAGAPTVQAGAPPVVAATEAARTPEAVKQLLEAGYRYPQLHEVTLAVEEAPSFSGPRWKPGIQIWHRRYDGVDILADVRTSTVDGIEWTTRWHRELVEPESVRRSEVLSVDAALAKAEIRHELLESGAVKARLVYRPVHALIDGELVVKSFRLCEQLTNNEDQLVSYVDAYTGEIVDRVPMRTDVVTSAPSVQYGRVTLDTTTIVSRLGTKSAENRDPLRVSATGPGGPINGQGFANGTPTSSSIPLAYLSVSTARADYTTDVAFGLRQSWDYFAANHARRGLQDRRQLMSENNSDLDGGNDAIAFYSVPPPLRAGDRPVKANAFMYPKTGLIEILQGRDWELLTAVDVLGHEWSHAVYSYDTDDTDQADYWGANGGLNESNSDLFGERIEARALQSIGRQADDEIHDDWMFGTTSNGLAIRSMCNPRVDDSGIDVWSAALDDPDLKVEPHIAAGPVNRVKCLLGRGMTVNGSGFSPELQSPIVPNGFPALGSAVVAKLQYQTLVYLRGYPIPRSFQNARQATLDSATSLYGKYSPTYKAIEDAFAVIGIGATADRAPPTVRLVSGLTVGANSTMIAEAQSFGSEGIKSVSFVLNGILLGTVNAAPPPARAPAWQMTSTLKLPYGVYPLVVTATDFHLNSQSVTYQVTYDTTPPTVTVTDVTPCAPPADCSAWRTKRQYRVDAVDSASIGNLSIWVDGPPYDAIANAASYVFTVNFSVGGQHYIIGRATDAAFNGAASVGQYFDIDLTPPTLGSGAPAFSSDPVVEGRVLLSYYCATDPSGIKPGKPTLWMDGIVQSLTLVASSVGNGVLCASYQLGEVPLGVHTFRLEVADNWGNIVSSSRTFTVPRVSPSISQPSVAVDTQTPGHITVSATYGATHGIASVELWICGAGYSNCVSTQTFHPSATVGQTSHTFDVTGLVPGRTYSAEVGPTANNGLMSSRGSPDFTIPLGGAVYAEHEPNNYPTVNDIPANTTQIKGTFNGTTSPTFAGFFDQDFFHIQIPAGKTLTVSSTFNCQFSAVALSRLDPSSGSFVQQTSTDSDGTVTLGASSWPSSVASTTTFEIELLFNLTNGQGWPTATTPGCADPRYALNLSVQ